MERAMISMQHVGLLRIAGLSLSCFLFAACGSDKLAELSADLPDASLATPYPGCLIVSVSPAVALRRESNGARALMRHEADCFPDVAEPADWLVPYRIRFEQEFAESRQAPGGIDVWTGGETRFVDDPDAPAEQIDAATDGTGRNCALFMEKFESTAIPCIASIDASTGDRAAAMLEGFRRQSTFTINVRGENHLNALLLGRDAMCLEHWRQSQHQLDNRFDACLVK
jgi:hypothetical protein